MPQSLTSNSLAYCRTFGYSASVKISFCFRYHDLELAATLLQCGANVNLACGELNMTPLLIATHNHDTEIVRLLLESGSCPDVMDKWNYTPLMYAAIHNEPDVVELLFNTLIEGKCDVNFGATLTDASEKSIENTNILDINACCENSYITYVREPLGAVSGTALHLAVQNPHLPSDLIETLLRAGSDVNARNLYGQTPIIGAMLDIYYDYHSNIQSHTELLLKFGADANVPDIRGWTPFHYAAQRGSISCIELLLKAGGDTNSSTPSGETPLWILLARGWREAAKFLLQNGCDYNQPISSKCLIALNDKMEMCRYGQIFPVEFAICNKFYDVAQLMLECGCKITETTWVGNRQKPFDSKHANLLHVISETQERRCCIKTLSACCKYAIRNFLGEGIIIKLENIALPQSLKNYVCLK